MSTKLKHTNAGLKVKGNLKDVATTAKEVEKELEKCDIKKEAIEGFNEWRPREEDTEQDLKKKTVEQAVLTRKELEEEVETLEKKFEYGVRDITSSLNEKDESVSRLVFKLVFSKTIKATRKTEALIYSKLMLKFNPYYFDTHDLSANLKCENSNEYCLDINLMEKESRKVLKKEFRE